MTSTHLAQFHDPFYIKAVAAAERMGEVPENIRGRYSIGVNGNSIFDGMSRRSVTACGGGMFGARLLMEDKSNRVYSLGAGQHHAQPNRASGFRFFNEPVLTVHAMLEYGSRRVFYLDLDAHHGDGVQHAFAYDDRVFTLSIHKDRRWTMVRDDSCSGNVLDRTGEKARNIPAPPDFNDTESDFLTTTVVLPSISDFFPDVVYV